MTENSELPEDAAGEAPNTANGSAANELRNTKGSSARPHWSVLWRDAKAPVIVVILTVSISAASLGLSINSQVDVADQYNRSQEQALLSLVVSISQEKEDTVQSDLRALADGQEANMIIEELPQSQVPSVEKYQVGMALETGYDFQPALKLLQEAGTEASDPVTAADSWREAANILYRLNRNKESEYDITKARTAINPKNATIPAAEDNVAYTDYFDMVLHSSIRPVTLSDCKVLMNDWNQAEQVMGRYKYTIPDALQAEQETAINAANTYCHALLPNPPEGGLWDEA